MKLQEKLSSISYSNISTFIDCPRKWKLNYVDKKYVSKQSLDLPYGTSIHEAIQEYLKEYYGSTIAELSDRRQQVIDKYCNYFIERFLINYQISKDKDKNLKVTSKMFQEYVNFGLETIRQFIPKTTKYFPKRNVELAGIQVELNLQTPLYPGLKFKGFIDILLYNKKTEKYIIIDLKTARQGWSAKTKKDQSKRLQLILYKYLYSIDKGVDIDNIDVHFLVLKKTIYKQSEFKISRIQEVKVPNAKRTVDKYLKWIEEILFKMNTIVQGEELGNINPLAKCQWCPYKGVSELCDRKKQLKVLRQREKLLK